MPKPLAWTDVVSISRISTTFYLIGFLIIPPDPPAKRLKTEASCWICSMGLG